MRRQILMKYLVALCALFGMMSCHSSSTSSSNIVTDQDGCADAPLIPADGGPFISEGALPQLMGAAYFRLNVPAGGSWYRLETANETLSVYAFDPVVSVLSGDGSTVLAAVDDSFVRSSIDPSFMYYAAGGQSLCVKVESYEGWTQSTVAAEYADYDLDFTLGIFPNPNSSDYYDLSDAAGNDSIAEAQPLALAADGAGSVATYSWVHGQLDATNDVDMFVFRTGGDETLTDVFMAMRPGAGVPLSAISGSGTTASVHVELLDTGEQVIAALDLSSLRQNLSAVLAPDTTYFLRVSGDATWSPGANDFYSLLLYSEPVSSFNFETSEDNNTTDGAELISLDVTSGGYLSGYWFGTLDDSLDVDTYRLEFSSPNYLLLYCKANTMGSGLNHFEVRALSMDGQEEVLVQSGIEEQQPIEWSDGTSATDTYVTLPAGTSYLQIAGERIDSIQSSLYFCNVIVVDASK